MSDLVGNFEDMFSHAVANKINFIPFNTVLTARWFKMPP